MRLIVIAIFSVILFSCNEKKAEDVKGDFKETADKAESKADSLQDKVEKEFDEVREDLKK